MMRRRLAQKVRAWRRALRLWIAGETRTWGLYPKSDGWHHISVPVAVQSIDPATARALLLAQADTIAALVRRA